LVAAKSSTSQSSPPGDDEGGNGKGKGEEASSIQYIIPLNVRDELSNQEDEVVDSITADFRTTSIVIVLGNKYNNNFVISGFDPTKWRTNIEYLKEVLEEKRVDSTDANHIVNTIDANYHKVVDAYLKMSESREERERQRMMAMVDHDFDKKIEVIRENVVSTFIEPTSGGVAVIHEGDHCENRQMSDASFRSWIGNTWFKHAQAERQAAIDMNAMFIPSESKSILSEEATDKIQTILIFEALGLQYDVDRQFEQEILKEFKNQEKINIREIYGITNDNDVSIDEDDGTGSFSASVAAVDNIFSSIKKDVRKKLYLRVASHIDSEAEDMDTDNWVAYDLGDNTWTYILITRKGGVQLVRSTDNTPSPFKRYSVTSPQRYPVWPYPKNILEQFMRNTNVYKNKENRMLTEVLIISLFMLSEAPKPILCGSGSQGTGKSTLQEMLKLLVDPGSVLTVTAQTDQTQAIQALSHSYLTIFDNVSEIKEWLSDLLCRVITKTGFQKRRLYSDDEDIIYSLQRAVGFNGLSVTATKADLLERILKISLDPINADDREKIIRIMKRFDKMLPYLLAFIFDTIHKVLLRLGEVNLKQLPRMADWAELGELIARVLGYDNMAFINAYNENLGITSVEAVEANPIALAIMDFMENIPTWSGSAKMLLKDLNKHENVNGRASTTRRAGWPSTSQQLTSGIDKILVNLREMGIIYDRGTKKDKTLKTFKITLVNQNYTPPSSDNPYGDGEATEAEAGGEAATPDTGANASGGGNGGDGGDGGGKNETLF
jgi:hypothetical protein